MAGSEGQGKAASAATESLPNELPWTGKPFGRQREPTGWIMVLANPVFQVAGVAAVITADGLTLQNVDPVDNKKAGENLPRLKNGSPCATLFITVLFLQQLTENLQYQRVIKDRAAAEEAVAASMSISDSNWHLERLTEAHTCS